MAYHVICSYCEKSHFGEQVWDEKIMGYICINCAVEIEERFMHQALND
jgi:hypothetical protein